MTRVTRIATVLVWLALLDGGNLSSKPAGTATPPQAQQPTSLSATGQPATIPAGEPPTDVPAVQQVLVYLVAVGDNGASGQKFGCGDSLVPARMPLEPTQAVLQAALMRLLSLHEGKYGASGLYNALYQSQLKVEQIALAEGKATVELTGQLLLGGECDDPRLLA